MTPSCYVHPDRVAGSVCRRCGRPICPECMHEAPVGWQCAECVKQGARISPTVRWRPRSAGPLGSTRVTPAVIALIVVNVVVYSYEADHPAFEAKYWLVPFDVHYRHQWYQLVTSAFLHVSVTHLLLNMVSLVIVGPAIESELGRIRFALLYLLSAFGGSVGFYLLAPVNAAGLGASGAIFGLMGAYFVIARSRRWDLSSITGLLVVNLIYSFADTSVAWQDHIGGLITGALVGLGLALRPARGRPSELAVVVQSAAVAIAALAVLGLLVQVTPGQA